MTSYLLDTTICSYLMREKDGKLLQTLQQKVHEGSSICISAITYAELRLGSRSKKAAATLPLLIDALVERLDVIIPLDDKAVEQAEHVYSQLQRKGLSISFNDALIAGCALARQCVMVTHNVKEFSRIPDLGCEDWV